MTFFKKFLLQVGVGVIGLYLIDHFLVGVRIEGIEVLFYAGLTLGIINFFIRPVLRFITIPLRILTLGLFTFFINIAILWSIDHFFKEVTIEGIATLFYATLIIWILEVILQKFTK